MIRIPRVRLSLVLAALVILLVVPMAGARTLGAPSIHSAGGGWLGAALAWVQGLAGVHQAAHRHGHPGSLPNQKDGTIMQPSGGGCIGPDGRPKPICL